MPGKIKTKHINFVSFTIESILQFQTKLFENKVCYGCGNMNKEMVGNTTQYEINYCVYYNLHEAVELVGMGSKTKRRLIKRIFFYDSVHLHFGPTCIFHPSVCRSVARPRRFSPEC